MMPIAPMRYLCVSDLALIGRAKDEAAMERLWTNGTPVANSDSCVNGYVSQTPGVTNVVRCPMNGTYRYNAIGSPPTCSVPGHVLREEQ